MSNYIKTTIGHYKGDVLAWDVVSEAVPDKDDGGEIIDTVWNQVPNYICKAFNYAAEADPDALMMYNDYGHGANAKWMKTKSDKVYNLVKYLLDNSCKIHGVSFQLHVDLNFDDELINAVKANIKRYAELGIFVHITDLDVRCVPDDTDESKCKTTWGM